MRRTPAFLILCTLILSLCSCFPPPVPDVSPSPEETRNFSPSPEPTPSPLRSPEEALREIDPEALREPPRVALKAEITTLGGFSAACTTAGFSLSLDGAAGEASSEIKGSLESVAVESVDILTFIFPVEPSSYKLVFFGESGDASDAMKDGKYRCELTAEYKKSQDLGYWGKITYALNVTVASAPVVTLSLIEPSQGDVLGVGMSGAATAAEYTLKASHLEGETAFFDVEEKLGALVQIPVAAKPGTGVIEVYRAWPGGEPEKVAEAAFTIKKRAFSRQDLTVTGETASIYTSDNLKKDNERVAEAKSASLPEKLWKGAFIRPVEGRISTQFAQERYTNGKYTSRHSGVDIAAPEGTEVRAAAAGKVVFSGDLIVTGKTVIIDHGLSLFTSYCHLSEIKADAGMSVGQWDVIGLVGSTGYSTGPHLHYNATLKGSIVDPFGLEERDPLAMISQYED